MKNSHILLVALTVSACSGWLDVSPLGEVKESDMYETEDGFKGVLTGAYISMATAPLYGHNMTIQMPELLARHWDVVSSSSVDAYLRDYNFDATAVKNLIANTWIAYFNDIVGLNSLIAAIDDKKEIFTNGNYELIKGEAKGLRAFLHFDILRFWGPPPTNADTSKIAIPYVKEVTKEVTRLQSISYGRVLREIIADLDEAEELLQNDPITRYSPSVLNSESNSGPYDEFQRYRTHRFNYLAVKATKARYYHWIGQTERAASYAREVIAATTTGNAKIFNLATEATVGGTSTIAPDLLMSVEHIFALHNPRLSNIVQPFFYMSNCKQELLVINQAYETNFHSNDIRCKTNRYWEEFQTPRRQSVFKKFYNPDTQESVTVMPLIRLAEMYFILMERGTLEEANELLVAFRIARVMDASIDNSLLSPSDVLSRLEKEYRKDFYGEGQMFYFYKLHGAPPITWPALVQNVVYQVPKPEQQTDFETAEN
jgi:hypothetical protein